MATFRRVITCGVLIGAVAAVPRQAQAGMFEDVVRGLQYAGFQFSGRENPLSGGAEFQLYRFFDEETLDFGAADLTLTGPLGFTFETGGRSLGVLDFSLSTGDQAFEYVFNSSSGAQDYRVEGNFLLDATGSINTFGFYDLRLQLSSRQGVFLDGRFQDGAEEQLDYDIGPIDVSGNIFADLLARLFDPVFEAIGAENILDSFSGRAQYEDLMQLLAADAEAKWRPGDELISGEAAKVVRFGEPFAEGQVLPATVPEPGLLLLLLGPTAYLIGRRPRR